MKKYLVLTAATVAALAGCTKNSVVDIADNRAIEFEQFVNNNTRTVTEVESLDGDYYVIGRYSTDGGTNYVDNEYIYKNQKPGEATYYWTQGWSYAFGAYANGADGKIDNAAFEPNVDKLTFTDYTVGDKDLVAAIATKVDVPATGVYNVPVPLSFKHMLSQVKFSFSTTDADAYTITITDLKITDAAKTGDCIYDGTLIQWENISTSAYTYASPLSVKRSQGADDVMFVMPQTLSSEEALAAKVTFTANIQGLGRDETANFSANLTYEDKNDGSSVAGGKWTAGYKYNYNIVINGSDIKPGELNPIVFKEVTVEPWASADDNTVTPVIP